MHVMWTDCVAHGLPHDWALVAARSLAWKKKCTEPDDKPRLPCQLETKSITLLFPVRGPMVTQKHFANRHWTWEVHARSNKKTSKNWAKSPQPIIQRIFPIFESVVSISCTADWTRYAAPSTCSILATAHRRIQCGSSFCFSQLYSSRSP